MSDGRLSVLHVYKYLFRRLGGPATVVPALCRELSLQSCNVTILTLGYNENDIEDYGNARIIKSDKHTNVELLINSTDIVHIHDTWPPFQNKVMRLCRRHSKSYIISPHASLMLSDIFKSRFKLLKKYAAWHVYSRRNFVRSSGFHVTGKEEFDDLSRIGFRNPCAIISNGINTREFAQRTENNLLYSLFPKAKGKRVLLFFSRITKRKGIDLLAHAWGEVGRNNPSWHLIIAGPDTENIWAKAKSILDSYDRDNYTRGSYLSGYEKAAVLQHSDILILPTLSESFGIVIAESLTAGTPVITTSNTPWEKLEQLKCGWVTEADTTQIVKTLTQAMRCEPHALLEMGRRGQEYINRNFDWRDIATDMKRYYEYILGRRNAPESVHALQGNGKPSLPLR